jgi:hypothetical protein
MASGVSRDSLPALFLIRVLPELLELPLSIVLFARPERCYIAAHSIACIASCGMALEPLEPCGPGVAGKKC